MRKSSLSNNSLKTRYAKLQHRVKKLESNVLKLTADLEQADIVNSELKIDNLRFKRQINALEAKIAKFNPLNEKARGEIEEKASELALKMLKTNIAPNVKHPPDEHGKE